MATLAIASLLSLVLSVLAVAHGEYVGGLLLLGVALLGAFLLAGQLDDREARTSEPPMWRHPITGPDRRA